MNQALSDKILVLGVDGMDPMLTTRFLRAGKMPHTAEFIKRGAQRKDLAMLGGMPTITPPMWTTLATGANPNTHGITCFWQQSKESLDTIAYAMNSRKCKAEQLWNVFAEAGKKTMVWHWPGSAWPPTSDSPNLSVVDGAQPNGVNMGHASIDWEKAVIAREDITEVSYKPKASSDTGAGCIIADLPEDDNDYDVMASQVGIPEEGQEKTVTNIMLSHEDGELAGESLAFDMINSPLQPATGWVNAPEGAKEFTIITSNGFVRRPALLVKNAAGVYDKVLLYKNKKSTEPIVELPLDVLVTNVIDDVLVGDDNRKANRHWRLLDVNPSGTSLKLWMSTAFDLENDRMFHPKSLYQDIVNNVGMVPMLASTGGKNIDMVNKLLIPTADFYCQWQADSLNYLIQNQNYEVIFSHIHNVDNCGHLFWNYAKDRVGYPTHEDDYQKAIEDIYVQTDHYIGEFMHLLDEGWTILIVSDHGLITGLEVEYAPLLGDAFGTNVKLLQELGFLALKTDENGNDIKEVDWANTRAIAPRGNHIYINLKGRNATGIVDPADQYALEDEIIDALYNYREPHTNKRVVAMAMRNKDAAVIGMSGPECGDIIYFIKEGFNRLHGDAWSTFQGYKESSVSPIFMAAGKGIKAGFTTERVIREVDVAPTVAVLGGVRMPAQCEGAPVYQILTETF